MDVTGLVRNHEGGVQLGHTRTHGPGLPSPETVRSAAVEAPLEREGGGIAVCISGTGNQSCGKHLPVIAAEAPGVSQREFSPDILGIRGFPDYALPVLILLHQLIEGAKQIAGVVYLQSGVEKGGLRIALHAGGIVEISRGAEIEVVRIGIPHKRIAGEGILEVLVELVQVYDIETQRIDLVIELAVGGVVTVGGRNHIPRIFGTVLVVVGEGDVGAGHVRALEYAVGQSQEFRETESCRTSQLVGVDIVLEAELEIAHETQVQPFTAMEYVLVVIGNLGRDAEESGRVHRALEIDLEALKL